jgi:hypothetical protein
MLQNILLRIKKLVRQNNLLEDNETDKLVEFLKWFNKDEYIYIQEL